MAFTANFSISQTADVQSFIITDTSAGSDPNLTGRTISLFLADGSLLGGSVIPWPLADGNIKTIDLLQRDYSINITVNWQSSSPLPSPSTYTKSALYTFVGNSVEFEYGVIQQLAANPNLASDTLFYDSLGKLQTLIDSAETAGSFDDQSNSQFMLDLAYNLIRNEANYF